MTFGLLSVNMINSTINIKVFTTALILGCFFMMGCENKIEVVQNLGKKSIGIEEGKDIVLSKDQIVSVVVELKIPEITKQKQKYLDKVIQKTSFGDIILN